MASRRKKGAKKKRAVRGRKAPAQPSTKKKRRRPAAPSRSRASTKRKRVVRRGPAAAPPPPKKRKKRVPKPTPAQRGAVTRTLRAFTELPAPRSYTRTVQKEIYADRRRALIAAWTRAGLSPESIRARLGWITRRRNRIRDLIAERREIILGTTLLHGSDPEARRQLRRMIREQDKRFTLFADQMSEAGFSYEETVNEWFSPKVQAAD